MTTNQRDATASICHGLQDIVRRHSAGAATNVANTSESHNRILRALEQFQECVRYLNVRRSKGAVLELTSEANVQDALFLMLRPWVEDLVSENPSDKVANRYAIADFVCPSAQTIIEAKYIRDRDHGKRISAELHDDIEMYRRHPHCRHLIFFVYDPESLIPDEAQLRNSVCEDRVISGRCLSCYLIVKP